MTRSIRPFWVCLLWVVPAFAAAQPALLSLDEAVRIALKQNYDIEVSRQQIALSQNNYTVGNAGILPTISLSATPNLSISTINQKLASGAEQNIRSAQITSFNGGLNLGWTLFDGAAMFLNYKRLGLLLDQSKLQTRIQVEATLASVIRAYSETIRQQRLLDFLKTSREVSLLRFKLAESRLRLGAGSKIEETQAHIDFLADSANIIRQEQSLTLSKIELNRLMGRSPETEFVVSDSLAMDPMPSYDDLLQKTAAQNRSLMLRKQDQELAVLGLRIQQAAYYPTLTLNTGYNFGYNRNPAGFARQSLNNSFFIGGTLAVNIFDGLRQRQLVRNARAQVQINRLLVQREGLEAETALLRSWQQYQAALRVMQVEQSNFQLASQNLSLARESYRLGNLSGLELKIIQADYINISSRLANATNDAKRLETDLRQQAGLIVARVD
jgi:outer membrane protein